jgi:hypothetical protein
VLIDELPMLFAIGQQKLQQIVSNEDFWVPTANIQATYQPQRLRPLSNSVNHSKQFWNLAQKPVGDDRDPAREFSIELRMVGIFEPEQKKVWRGTGWLQEQDTGVLAGSAEPASNGNGSRNPKVISLPTPCVFLDASVSLRRVKKSCKRLLWSSSDLASNQLQYAVIALDSDSCLLLSFISALSPSPSPDAHQRLALQLERACLITNTDVAIQYQRCCSNELFDQLFSKPIAFRAEKNYRFNMSCPHAIFQVSVGSSKFGSPERSPVQQFALQTHLGVSIKAQERLSRLPPNRLRMIDSPDWLSPSEGGQDSDLQQAELMKGNETLSALDFHQKLPQTGDQISLGQELSDLAEKRFLNKKELELLSQVLFGMNRLRLVSSCKSDCMVLQEALRKLEPRHQPQIIHQVLERAVESMSDVSCSVYGNFLMQIMISKLTQDQRVQMLHGLVPTFEEIACHPKGIFCLQFLIDQLQSSHEVDTLLLCIAPSIYHTIKNPQAGFVFKKAVQVLDEGFSSRLWQLIRRSLADVCCDKYGICVVKFIISKFDKSYDRFAVIVKDFNKIVSKCKLNSHFNFGMQHLIEVANKQSWQLEEMEDMLSSYFSEENRIKIRSVSVAYTIVLILTYHRKIFVDSILRKHLKPPVSRMLTPQETRIFTNLEEAYPHLKSFVTLLKMMTKRQRNLHFQPTQPSQPLSPGFSHH